MCIAAERLLEHRILCICVRFAGGCDENERSDLRNERTVVSRPKRDKVAEQRRVLSRTDARHVVVLTERRQVLVELFDTFFVCLDAFAHQFFFELWSCQCPTPWLLSRYKGSNSRACVWSLHGGVHIPSCHRQAQDFAPCSFPSALDLWWLRGLRCRLRQVFGLWMQRR